MTRASGEMLRKVRFLKCLTQYREFLLGRVASDTRSFATATQRIIQIMAPAKFSRQIECTDLGDLRGETIRAGAGNELIRLIQRISKQREDAAMPFLVLNDAAEVIDFLIGKFRGVLGAFDDA